MGATAEECPKSGMEPTQRRVIISDFDGVLVRRQLGAEAATTIKETASLLTKRLFHHSSGLHTLENFSIEGAPPSERGLGFKGVSSLYFHNRRFPVERAVQMFTEGLGPDDRVIIVTGRPDYALFRDMSVAQKDRIGLKNAKIILTPLDSDGKKRRSVATKGNAIEIFGATDLYDDNKATIEELAQRYQGTRFHYVDYGAHIAEDVLERCPNIEVVPAAEWLKPIQVGSAKGDSLTRSSSLRSKLGFKKKIARAIVEVFPLNPDLLTVAGGLLTLQAVRELTEKNSDGKPHFLNILPAAGKLGVALAADVFDGAVAEEMNVLQPGSHDKKRGGALDAAVDKGGALVMSGAKMVTAFRRKDWYGFGVAGVAGASHALSALYRAKGEARGESFPEHGRGILKDPFGFFGAQLGRNCLAIPSTIWPNLGIHILGRRVTLPDVTDTISAVSNFYVARKRSRGGEEIKLPEAPKCSNRTKKYREWKNEFQKAEAEKLKIMDEGAYRARWMRLVAIGGIGGVIALGGALFLHDKFLKRK